MSYYALRELGAVKFYNFELGMALLPQSSGEASNLFLSLQIYVSKVDGIARRQPVLKHGFSLASFLPFYGIGTRSRSSVCHELRL